ncbi:FixH family protein [Ornithinibacillus contaminans]|uniref:FixH family protein n=1 Tax=Ornithinibacillus contaminans TaxID=694055 RepID=UPI00064DD875|nr:FixH family protein [Ornithinibacillus contaminans]
MKKSYISLLLISLILVLLAACGKEDTNATDESSDDVPEMINVDVQFDPETDEIALGDTFTISATVTQGSENVNDADEVEFEFWKEGQSDEEHELIPGEFQADGIYSIEKTVEEAGTYYVIAHVTAREMHVMPQTEFVIGGEEATHEEHAEHDHGSEADSGHDHHHSVEGLVLHIMADETVAVNEEVTLTSHIQLNDEPVSDAKVQFEIWKEGAEKHEYVDASEAEAGEYTVDYTFPEPGDYNLQLHFRKDDMHEHKQTVITVE